MIEFIHIRGIKHLPKGMKIKELSNECLEWIVDKHLDDMYEGHAAMVVTECLKRMMKLLPKERI